LYKGTPDPNYEWTQVQRVILPDESMGDVSHFNCNRGLHIRGRARCERCRSSGASFLILGSCNAHRPDYLEELAAENEVNLMELLPYSLNQLQFLGLGVLALRKGLLVKQTSLTLA
jgi:hypothetical protein